MNKCFNYMLLIIFFGELVYCGDSSKIIFSKLKTDYKTEFSISDIDINADSIRYTLNIDLEIPFATNLSVMIYDTSGSVVFYLINGHSVGSGAYNIQWEMEKCGSGNCPYPPGRYYCDIETDQFYFRRDFYIK